MKILISGIAAAIVSVISVIPISQAEVIRPNPIDAPLYNIGTYDHVYQFKIENFPLKKLTDEKDDPYYYDFRNGKPVEELLKSSSVQYDENGMPMVKYGDNYYYHPVRTAQEALYYINSYKQLGKPEHLEKAKTLAAHLVQLSAPNKLMYFAYPFDYTVLGRSEEPLDKWWYSAMSQGQALSVFSRLYELIKDETFINWANQTFRSFLRLNKSFSLDKPWVSAVDKNNYLWFEEYPTETKKQHVHVLNGFIFAVYGIYDYYLITNSPQVKSYIDGALTTLLAYGDRFRLPGQKSYYALKYNNTAGNYHDIHIRQFRQLYKITADTRFQNMSDRFYADTALTKSLQPTQEKVSYFTQEQIQFLLNQN